MRLFSGQHKITSNGQGIELSTLCITGPRLPLPLPPIQTSIHPPPTNPPGQLFAGIVVEPGAELAGRHGEKADRVDS